MAWGLGEACPKPAKGASRKARHAARLKAGKQMRDEVWRRVRDAHGDAYCEDCGAGPLLRTTDVLHPRAGHVAHTRGRRVAPEDRFNPDEARLACRDCHMKEHSMRFR